MPKLRNQNPNAENKNSYSVYAKKSFGQNFLVDRNYIDKIVQALNLNTDETVVEIGAGRGALTEKLLESGARVMAIELDRDLIPVLTEKFKDHENFTLIENDALKINFLELFEVHASDKPSNHLKSQNLKFKLAANLPYYISTAILQHLIVHREAFSEMVLMFQREVVERITAEPASSERGFLSVLTEAYLKAEKLFDVPPAAFRPAPKIWSAVVRLISKDSSENEIKNEETFRRVVSAGFAQRRKTILNNFKNLKIEGNETAAEHLLGGCGIELSRRAETLSLSEWICLANSIESV